MPPTRVREVLAARGLDVSALAKRSGLSRQAAYRMLDPAYEPFSEGFRAIARALEVDPADLVGPRSGAVDEVSAVLKDAAQGDARAFEVLPAELARLSLRELERLAPADPDELRLLTAAGEILHAHRPEAALRGLLDTWSSRLAPTRCFAFGARVLGLERLAERSPALLLRHGVLGAFDLADFARHFA